MEYQIKKKVFKKEDIDFANVFFDNGDYLSISKNDIIDIDIKLYDRLVMVDDGYCNSFCAVAESGYIKLMLTKKFKGIYNKAYLYNLKEYRKDRVNYIKNRFCNEGGIKYLRFFDENNWHHTLYGDIKAELDGEFVILKFEPRPNMGSSLSETHTIFLPEVGKSMIKSVDLDFENCEGVYIYDDEIVDIQLKFKEELSWEIDYIREIENGYIRIKLDDERNFCRKHSLFLDELAKGKKGNRQVENRLCGKKGFDLHDICHLYIDYNYAGFGLENRECLGIEDIRNKEEFDEIERIEEEVNWSSEWSPCFVGGCCQKSYDGTILIKFGTTALKDKDAQTLLEKYSVLNPKKRKEFIQYANR